MLRLVVVCPLLPLRVGDGFPLARWPLHLTVAPTFVIQADLGSVAAAVTSVLDDVLPITLGVGADEGFGRSGRIPVSLVHPSGGLLDLHRRLTQSLSAGGAVFDDPDFMGSGYRPHVTMTKLERAQPGDVLRLEQAVIVDMEPLGEQRLRRVVRAWSLQPGRALKRAEPADSTHQP